MYIKNTLKKILHLFFIVLMACCITLTSKIESLEAQRISYLPKHNIIPFKSKSNDNTPLKEWTKYPLLLTFNKTTFYFNTYSKILVNDNPNTISIPIPHLDDRFKTLSSNIPEHYRRNIQDENIVKKNLFEGYRIQIISTSDVSLADSTKINYDLWIKDNPLNYTPESYISFIPPYYRVHIGDFTTREQAFTILPIIRKSFTKSWVVPDRIEPRYIPFDDRGRPLLDFHKVEVEQDGAKKIQKNTISFINVGGALIPIIVSDTTSDND